MLTSMRRMVCRLRCSPSVSYTHLDVYKRQEILGTAKLILEGCDGVIEYETEKIGLRCGRRAVWVEGKSLRLLCLEEDGAVITGHIEAVRFA